MDINSCKSSLDVIFNWILLNIGSSLPLVKNYIISLTGIVLREVLENCINNEQKLNFYERDFYTEISKINNVWILRKWFEAVVEDLINDISLTRYDKTLSIINKGKDFIREQYMKDITLDSAAETVLLSPQYFSKVFRQESGLAFINYLTEGRVEKAKEYLEKTLLSAKEISYKVGYNDPNYFFKMFKEVTGITPGEFK